MCRICGEHREEFCGLATLCPSLYSARENTFGPNGPRDDWTWAQLVGFIKDPRLTFLLETRDSLSDDNGSEAADQSPSEDETTSPIVT